MHDGYKGRKVRFFQTGRCANPFRRLGASSLPAPPTRSFPVVGDPMQTLSRALAALSLLLFGLCAAPSVAAQAEAAQEAPNTSDRIAPPEAVRRALLAGNTEAVLDALKELEQSRPEHRDAWGFYRGVAYQDAQRYADANTAFRQVVQQNPDGPWAQQALYRHAEMCNRLGLFEQSQAIYREAASHLRSRQRQSELAQWYIDMAAPMVAIDPSNPNAAKPRYPEAMELYRKALELELEPDVQATLLWEMGKCASKMGSHVEAAETLARIEALELPNHSVLRWKAMRLQGREWIAGPRWAEARDAMEDFLRATEALRLEGEDSQAASAALQAARASAHRVLGDAWLGLNRLPLALAEWQRGLDRYPAFEENAETMHSIASALQAAGRTDEAVVAWDALVQAEPRGEGDVRKAWETHRRQAQFSKAVTLADAGRPAAAREAFQEYARRFPNGESWSLAQARIVDMEHALAYGAQDQERWEEARQAWEAFVREHPLDERVARAQYDHARSYRLQALATEPHDRARLEQAVRAWRVLAQSYPGTDLASEALYHAGETLEQDLRDMPAAVEAYRAVTFGNYQGHANAALERLTRSELSIETERIVRSQEDAKIRVQTRNVAKLELHIYPLDLETYFRKHRSYRGIENLDLDLIAPDQKIQHTVVDYEAYAPLEFDVVLPVQGPGVWAVAVASETHRATTLVIRSDLDLIFKSSSREAFVVVRDMVQQKPAAGVRLLMAHGTGDQRELLAQTTDEQGVARWSASDDQSFRGTLQVFGQQSGHITATHLSTGGLKYDQELTSRSLVYSERPAYQPGETIRWRAIVRAAEGDVWVAPASQTASIELLDGRGLVVARSQTILSEWGTAHGSFVLPEQAQPGDWSLVCDTDRSDPVRHHLRVEAYRLPRAEVLLTPSQTVVWRGDTVVIEALAQTTYGAPLAQTPLRWNLPGRVEDVLTDAEGRASVELETRHFTSDARTQVQAQLLEENTSSAVTIFVSTRGYTPSVSVPRSVELSGSAFPVTIRATTPDGEGAERTLTLQAVQRKSEPGGRWSEKTLVERSVKTDAAGELVLPLTLEASGTVLLRVFGEDRFGHRVEAQTQLTVSGPEDEVPLRLLTEEVQIQPGQTLRLQAALRKSPGHALLTIETNRVLEHRWVSLDNGVTDLAVSFDASMAPNVQVGLAMMAREKFYSASTEVQIVSPLRIAMQPVTTSTAPGSAQEFQIQVTDRDGRPVRTELSLGAVDEALYALFRDRTPNLQQHFQRALRVFPMLQTQSSCTFAYEGKTQAIAQTILEERQREKSELEWRASRERLGVQLDAPSTMPVELSSQVGRFVASQEEAEEDGFNDAIGMGGGAGGRFGGRRNLKAGGANRSSDRSGPPEESLAYWVADLTTDAQGRATVTIPWPDRSTRWRLTAHGVGQNNHFGSATIEQTVQANFFVELNVPPAWHAGDQPRIAAEVHSQQSGRGTLTLTVETAAGSVQQSQEVTFGEQAVTTIRFAALEALIAGRPALVRAELAAQLPDGAQRVTREQSVAIRRAGLEHFDHASGRLTDRTTLTLDLAGEDREVELHFGPHWSHALAQAALGDRPQPYRCGWGFGPAEGASDLLGALAFAQRAEWSTGHPQYGAVTARIRSLIATLSAQQRPDGNWGWKGTRDSLDAFTSAHATLALAYAQRAGFEVDATILQRATTALQGHARDAGAAMDELKVHLHHALAAAGQGDFGALNRLHRAQDRLSIAGKAHLVLALERIDRHPMALEVAQILAGLAETGAVQGLQLWPHDKALAWYGHPLEVNAWTALALQTAGLDGPAQSACESLLAQFGEADRKALGIVTWALCRHVPAPESESGQATVVVSLEGAQPERVAVDATGTPGRRLRIPLPDAAPGSAAAQVQLSLELEGGTPPVYQVVGRAWGPATKTKDAPGFYVREHRLLPEEPRYRGKSLPVGFGTVHERNPWINTREHVRQGEIVQLELVVRRHNTRDRVRDERADYLELEVPLPAGLELLESGPAEERLYRRDGQTLYFPLGAFQGYFRTTVDLVGVHAGRYVFPPAVLRSVYRPELTYVHDTKAITVRTPDEMIEDSYRATPDELFHLGKAQYENEDLAGARASLLPLMEEYATRLRPRELVETARMLLFASIEHGDDAEIVRFFEIIKERDAELFVPIEHVLRIGDAYAKLGEHERAMLIFRATLEETFGSDLKVVLALDAHDQWLAGTRVLSDLVQAYPDLPVVRDTDLAICDRLLQMAPRAKQDQVLRDAGIDRAQLMGMGIQRLRRFLALHGQSPLAGDAGLNLVSAFFELEDHEETAALCAEFAERFATPKYRDAFLYSQGVAEWYLGQDEAALQRLLAVAESTFEGPNGKPQPSENRALSHYIVAQIHHALQDVERAMRFYGMVDKDFPDARYALQTLQSSELRFAENVFRTRPGESARLEIHARNLSELELLAFPVDLMTLYLREKDLSRVTEVNLAGISPTLTRRIEVQGPTALRVSKQTEEVALPEPGAYLIMARGGGEHSSCLVLVSDLEVHVQDFEDGQVRVQVMRAGDGQYLRDVDIRVIGSVDGTVQVGETDPRGLYVANGVTGRSTVIARLEPDHYAFHLGEREMGAPQRRQRQEPVQAGQGFYLQNVIEWNDDSRDKRGKDLDRQMQQSRKGVQVLKVK